MKNFLLHRQEILFFIICAIIFSYTLNQRKVDTISAAPNSPRLYLAVSDFTFGNSKVYVLDTGNNTVVTTIPVGDDPIAVKISPDNTRAYVVNRSSDNVSVIDTATNTIVTTIPLGDSGNPVSFAINSTGTRLYTVTQGSDSLIVVDTTTNTVINTIPVGSFPGAVAAKPNGTLAYVRMSDGTIKVIDTSTSTVVSTITPSLGLNNLIFNTDGSRFYLTGDGVILIMDTTTNTEIAQLLVSPINGEPVLNDNGTVLYAVGHTCTVSVVNIGNYVWDKALPGTIQGDCGGISVNPADTRLYLSNTEAHTLSIVNASSGNLIKVIPLQGTPQGSAMKP